MAKQNYTALIEQLKTVLNEPSDSGNRRGYKQARASIMESDLSDAEEQRLTVFDMPSKSYLMIPLEAIQAVLVGGQSFRLAGAV